jgi:hypothetical protein
VTHTEKVILARLSTHWLPMPIFLPDADPLFSQRHLGTLLNNQIGGMENRINELADELFLSIPAQDLIDEISLGAYLQPLVLQAEHGVSHPPLEIESGKGVVPGATFRYFVEIPYTGASGLFNHEPSTNDLDRPTASLNSHSMQGSIIIKRVATTDVPDDELKASFDAELAKVQKYINYQALEIEPYNASLKAEAERIVKGRRERLLTARRIAASLGYRLYHRADAPITYVSPLVRRKLPTSVSTAFKPEPAIEEAEYQNILRIIENMSFVMERNPKVFSKAPEETIRDHYLVQLNGQYEGSATGETFNGEGKTDIIVRDGGANLFIAECKVWHGQKKFVEAIDQLLGYVTWRDTKTALIVFNRNESTTAVVETVKTTIEAHASYKRDSRLENETRLRSVFGRPDDQTREIIITVIVVPIPMAS